MEWQPWPVTGGGGGSQGEDLPSGNMPHYSPSLRGLAAVVCSVYCDVSQHGLELVAILLPLTLE